MFAFNFIFWICGCIILGVSIWIRVGSDPTADIESFQSAANLLIAIGCIIMVLGFLGCCGAVRESRCMLLMFFIGIFLILALQITAGVLAVVYKSKIEETLEKSIAEHIPFINQTKEFKDNLDNFQKENKCCGLINGSNDWGFKNDVPESCKCTTTNTLGCTADGYYEQKCLSKVSEVLKDNISIIAGVAFGLALIQLIGLGFSMTMYCQLKNK